jgi:hypothetical protein
VTRHLALLIEAVTVLDRDLIHLWPIDSRSWHRLGQADTRIAGLARDVARLPHESRAHSDGTGPARRAAGCPVGPIDIAWRLQTELRRRQPAVPPRPIVRQAPFR